MSTNIHKHIQTLEENEGKNRGYPTNLDALSEESLSKVNNFKRPQTSQPLKKIAKSKEFSNYFLPSKSWHFLACRPSSKRPILKNFNYFGNKAWEIGLD